MQSRTGEEYVVQAVDDAITVLMAVAAGPPAGLSELTRHTGVTKAKTYRLLRTLERRQMVWQDGEARYQLGNAALLLGTAATTQIDLVRVANPIMERLCDAVNETVQLRLRDGFETMCIAKQEPTRELRVHVNIGRRRPLTAGSSKVVLAYLPQEERDALLSRPLLQFTSRTILDRVRLEEELARIRADGYAISRGEVVEQLIGIAAPVFDLDGRVGASLNIVAPAFRVGEADIPRILAAVRGAADEISKGLGAGAPIWRPPLDT